jgi:hypothetical protein
MCISAGVCQDPHGKNTTMTSMSLYLRAYPEPLAPEVLESAALKAAVVANLARFARECGPYVLAGWAKERGLAAHYVDNCWVRVPVSAEELGQFLDSILGLTVAETLPPESRTGDFIIEAEEF